MSIPSESKNLSTLIISDKAETWYRDFLESSLGTLETKTKRERSKPTKSKKKKKDESGSLRKMICSSTLMYSDKAETIYKGYSIIWEFYRPKLQNRKKK